MHRILIADDENDILDLLEYNLEKAGYEVIRASDGHEVLHIAEEQRIDLFLLDIGMPKIDGIELCYKLRDLPMYKSTTIVFLTAKIEEYVEVAAFEAGADDFITKPIKPRALIARVRTLLRRKDIQTTDKSDLEISNVRISPESYTVFRDG